MIKQIWQTAQRIVWRLLAWSDRFPRPLRLLVQLGMGVLFLIGGVFGFLPILGFWMIPLGLLLIGLNLPFIDKRLRNWMAKYDTVE